MLGYYRFPTVHDSNVIFVCEDDLWHVPLEGGIARRITSGRGAASYPRYSPDGSTVTFTGTEEGTTEVFIVDAKGGPPQQLTWLGARTNTTGWSRDGEEILFRTSHAQPFARPTVIFGVGAEGGEPYDLGLGASSELAYGPDGVRAISRNSDDLARWKRYRGGTAGVIWIDTGDGWQRLFADNRAGHCRPMFVDGRLYFLTDRDGCGNLWSSELDGSDLRQETHFEGFYVRFPTTDGKTIVFARGGDLHRFTPGEGASHIEIDYASPQTQLQRRFVDAEDYVDDIELHPKGHSLTVTSRGKLYNFGLWEGAVRRTGQGQGVRYRCPIYLDGGDEILVVSDESGEECLEIHATDGTGVRTIEVKGIDSIGRILNIARSPGDDTVLFDNHRQELILLDLETGEAKVLAKSLFERIVGFDWSHDGRWIAYSLPQGMRTSIIRIYSLDTGETHDITEGTFFDSDVCFDPKGRYLYFLSERFFDPVGTKPFVVTLRKDVESPFFEKPRPLDDDDDSDDGDDDSDSDEESDETGSDEDGGDEGEDSEGSDVRAADITAAKEGTDEESGEGADGADPDAGGSSGDKDGDGDGDDDDPIEIDFDDISRRIEAFPAPLGNYGQLGATEKSVFWSYFPKQKSDSAPSGIVKAFSLEERETKTFARDVWNFFLCADLKTMALWGDGLQVVSATGPGPFSSHDEDDDKPSRKTGWIDFQRLSVEVDLRQEWPQMLREAWRLMRDHFWDPKLAAIDWEEVWTRYCALLDRLGSRAEFSDLVWCMQGELGTSHAYEMGGDYRTPPRYRPGFLGADLRWDPDFEHAGQTGGFRIDRIVRGEGWKKGQGSPLLRPGVNICEGTHIIAINGQRLSEADAIQRILVNEAGREVELVVVEEDARTVTVRALRSETNARYRDWVESNRAHVHEASGGRLGYVHIPDMGPAGYAEFNRGYLSEHERDGLVVDVRNNGGGNVSQLILEKLARKRIGYDITRWGQPRPYPEDSVLGPIVAVTDEHAGSDGDIFSHCFKLMKLGPLLGKRTWGGVVGIWPRHGLVDGSWTTQPEFSFWFEDVGFDVENYGTDPDIEVELEPESAVGIEDAQLNAAIAKAMELMEKQQPAIPTFR